MRIYLTGANGLLGTALTTALQTHPDTSHWTLRGASYEDYDITDETAVARAIDDFAPDIVVHAAANAVVDDCERAPGGAIQVNVAGTRNTARACQRVGARLLFVSSDYIFDGCDPPSGGYRENEMPNPVSVYGVTKVAGEHIAKAVPDHLIIRTSWLFGGADERVDVVLNALRRAQQGRRTTLIADQYSCPTYLPDLAAAIVFLLSRSEPATGVVHVCNTGWASWHTAVTYALSTLQPPMSDVLPLPTALDGYPFVGRRPRNSALNTDRLGHLGWKMPHWQNGIERFCQQFAESVMAR